MRSESINKLSLIYFACSVIFLASGCLFFVKELKSSAKSPAASRYKYKTVNMTNVADWGMLKIKSLKSNCTREPGTKNNAGSAVWGSNF